MPTLAEMLRQGSFENPNNPYSSNLLADALRGSLSNAESLGRGAAVAPLGIFGDVNALAREYITPRLPSKVQAALESLPAAPTTEAILAQIPRGTEARRESSGMEQLGAAMNPMGPIEAAKGVTKGLGAYGKLAGEAINDAMVYGRGPLAEITPQPMRMYVPATQEEAFQAAKKLRNETPQNVWRETGVAKFGEDFVKEIPDVNATASFTHLQGVNNGDMIPNSGFNHPELYALMPELKKHGQLGLKEDRMSGSFQKVGDNGSLIARAPNEKDLKTVFAHEMQHAVQDAQGWERGGSLKDIGMDIAENKLKAQEVAATLEKYQNKASDEARHASPDLVAQATQWAEKTNAPWYEGADKNMIVKDYLLSQDPVYASLYQTHADLAYNKPALLGAEETYKRLAGEAQARSTQNRVDLTEAQRRQHFPFELKSEANPYGLDVAPEDLIFRSQMSNKGAYK